MRYTDVEVGQTVLYSYRRQSHRWFSLRDTRKAVVLEKGVHHNYYAHSGGWSGGMEYKSTGQGIRLRVIPNPGDRNRDNSGAAEPYETVTQAAYLHRAEGEPLAIWEKARQDEADRRASDAADEAAFAETAGRFTRAGFDVEVGQAGYTKTAKGDVVIAAADVERLLDMLDLLAGRVNQ